MAETVTWEQRTTTLGGIAAGFVSAAALWFLLWRFLPEPASAGNLETAFACGAVAALLT